MVDTMTPKETSNVAASLKDSKVFDDLLARILFADKTVAELAEEYLSKYHTKELAAKKLINNQILIVSSSGGLSGFANSFSSSLAASVEKSLQFANISTALFIQIRMVAAMATIGGYDTHDDEVIGQIYSCLVTSAAFDTLKPQGSQVASRLFVKLIEKIPYDYIKAINQKMGFRFITKKGKHGKINLIDFVPIISAITVAELDALSSKLIAVRAYNKFIEHASETKIIESDTVIDEANP